MTNPDVRSDSQEPYEPPELVVLASVEEATLSGVEGLDSTSGPSP